MIFMFLGLVIGFVCSIIYCTIDVLITRKKIKRKKIKRNQLLWDEYSKNMTLDEKHDCFLEWLELNKAIHGDKFYYTPRM